MACHHQILCRQSKASPQPPLIIVIQTKTYFLHQIEHRRSCQTWRTREGLRLSRLSREDTSTIAAKGKRRIQFVDQKADSSVCEKVRRLEQSVFGMRKGFSTKKLAAFDPPRAHKSTDGLSLAIEISACQPQYLRDQSSKLCMTAKLSRKQQKQLPINRWLFFLQFKRESILILTVK